MCVMPLKNVSHARRREFVPADIYFFKVNNENTRTICEICSKLTIKTTLFCLHLAIRLT